MIVAPQGPRAFGRTRMKRYPSQYVGPDTGPGRCLKLLEAAPPGSGIVLDVGCGRAPLADRIQELGLDYVAIDVDADALAEVRGRGYETHQVDLGASSEELAGSFQQIIAGRPLGAILAIDVLEHLIEPERVLEALRTLPVDDSSCSLIVSVPNVTHFDIASKLLMGRWDLTEFGLLDDTHLRFFSERLFSELFKATGWRELAADDVISPISDQLFPANAPFLRPGAPGRELLHRISSRSHANFATYQFVRRFVPSEIPPGGHHWPVQPEAPEDDVFATVLINTLGDDGRASNRILEELDAQSSRDFETILLRSPGAEHESHNRSGVRVIESAPEQGLNAGIAAARGRYLCFIDETVRVSSRWIEAFQAQGELAGHVLSCQVVSVPPRRFESAGADELVASGKPFPVNPVDLLHPNRPKPTILAAYAVPLAAARVAGLRFEPQYGSASPAVFLSRAAELCGIAPLSASTVAVPGGVRREGDADLSSVANALDEAPLILPAGSATKIVELQRFRWRRTLPSRGLKRLLAAGRRRTRL